MYLSYIKLPCIIENQIRKLDSDLLKSYHKKLPFFANAFSRI
jgi:hypothetical protein